MDGALLLAALFAIVILFLYIAISMVPVSMANKRGRSKFGWFLFSFLISPLFAIIILACLGETEEKRMSRIMEEEEYRQMIRSKYNNTNNTNVPNPTGKSINDMYKSSGKTINEMYQR